MASRFIFPVTALALAVTSGPGHPTTRQVLPVCTASAKVATLVGKQVRVEGYIFDLGSHGFVLASERNCKGRGQLTLRIDRVIDTPIWRKAFAHSMGPKRALVAGVVRWEQAQSSGGRKPVLFIDRVESIAANEADLTKF